MSLNDNELERLSKNMRRGAKDMRHSQNWRITCRLGRALRMR